MTALTRGATGTALAACLLAACLLAVCLPAAGQPAGAGGQPLPTRASRDLSITIAIEHRLKARKGVDTHLLDIATSSGAVTVGGAIDNLIGRDLVIDAVSTVKFVSALNDRITILPANVDDGTVRDHIRQTLALDPTLRALPVRIAVRQGGVTLSGTVKTRQEKNLVADALKSVRGVTALRNEIIVSPKARRADQAIADDIRRRLSGDVWVNDQSVTPKVQGGRVRLTGSAGSLYEKERAGILSWVEGVEAVDTGGIEVLCGAPDVVPKGNRFSQHTDRQTLGAVQTAFRYEPRLGGGKLQVEVSSGIVTLMGVVDSLAARNAAGEDAQNVIGVFRVMNYLKVRPSRAVDDELLAADVKDVLSYDPYLYRHDIAVTAANGRVTLKGSVDNSFEKEHADDVVARINGVVDIDNMLVFGMPKTVTPADQEMRDDIVNAINWNALVVNSRDITVDVLNGIATINGTVSTPAERQAVQESAYEGGPKSVINLVRIRGQGGGGAQRHGRAAP